MNKLDVPLRFEEAENFKNQRCKVCYNGLWGYIDVDGREMVPIRYNEVMEWEDGIAAVRKDGLWGLFNLEGREIAPPVYDTIRRFSEGLSAVLKEGNWGYIDMDGRYVLRPAYDKAGDFDEGLAPVKNGKHWSYIDRNGREVISGRYAAVTRFSAGVAWVRQDGLWGAIDRTGEVLVPFRYEQEPLPFQSFAQGPIAIYQDGKYLFVTKQGREFGGEYENCKGFYEGLAGVCFRGKWGFVTADGVQVVDPVYDEVGCFTDGRAKVCIQGKWGLIDGKGRVVAAPVYDEIGDFAEGYVAVGLAGKFGFVDLDGQLTIPLAYEYIPGYLSSRKFNRGLICISEGAATHTINTRGEVVKTLPYAGVVQFSEGLAAVWVDKKWGYIDESGVMVIPPQLECLFASQFSGGLAAVSELFVGAGYIDRTGQYVVPLCYDAAESLTDGRGLVQLKGKYGFVNEKGELLAWSCQAAEEKSIASDGTGTMPAVVSLYARRFRFDEVRSFTEGLGAVCMNGKWGYLDVNGDMALAPRYKKAGKFYDGLAVVQIHDKWGVIDRQGNEVAMPRYDYIGSSFAPERSQVFYEGAALDGRVGFIDRQGRAICEFQYEDANHFSEGLAGVKKNGLWGFINRQGTLTILPCHEIRHASLAQFSEGLAYVAKDDRYGFIDKTGNLLAPLRYFNVFAFCQGLAAVENNAYRWGYINQAGQEVVLLRYEHAGDFSSEGLAYVQENDLYGYIYKSGQVAIPFRYDYAGRFAAGLAQVERNKYHGVIDTSGREVIPLQFAAAAMQPGGLCLVMQRDKKWGVLRLEGDWIVSCTYDSMSGFYQGLASVCVGEKWGYINGAGIGVIEPQFHSAYEFTADGLAAVQWGEKWTYVNRDGILL